MKERKRKKERGRGRERETKKERKRKRKEGNRGTKLGLGRMEFLFLIVLSLKLLKFFILFIYFLQNTISVPTSSPTVQESLTLSWDWGRVGRGGLVQESAGRRGRGAGLSTMRTRLEPQADEWRQTGRPDTHWGVGRAPHGGAAPRGMGMTWGVREVRFSQK